MFVPTVTTNKMSRSGIKRNTRGDEGSKSGKRKKESNELDLPSEACPVLVRKIEYGAEKAVPSISLSPDLDSLLHPMSSTDFLTFCFRKKAVHITCESGSEDEHSVKRVSGLRDEMCCLDPEEILRETSSENIFLWLREKGNRKSGKNGEEFIQSIEIADTDTAIALHKTAGHATYCRAPPKVEQSLVASLLRATGLGCGQYDPSGDSMVCMGRGEVETFISTDGHVTNWHFDFQENFTIQLSGTKRWTIQAGTIQDPVRGCTPHYASKEAVEAQLKAAHLFDRKFRFGYPETGVTALGDVVSITIKPGDVFYFPAGMWHKIETIEPGVSINVSLMASNYATVTSQALLHFLHKDKRWRAPIINNPTTSAVSYLKELLEELPSYIQELERHGAESIMPPILQYSPKFTLNEEDEWQDLKESEQDDEENKEEWDERGGAGAYAQAQKEADGGDNGSDSEENNEVIDPLEFDNYSDDWDPCLEPTSEVRLVRNPLAALHRMGEIKMFYERKQSCHEGIFVLNVNYAGNEMHQSAVRAVFCDNENGFVEKLYILERQEENQSLNISISDVDLAHAKFLVYHGYLICK